jgi:hypothetical protein
MSYTGSHTGIIDHLDGFAPTKVATPQRPGHCTGVGTVTGRDEFVAAHNLLELLIFYRGGGRRLNTMNVV